MAHFSPCALLPAPDLPHQVHRLPEALKARPGRVALIDLRPCQHVAKGLEIPDRRRQARMEVVADVRGPAAARGLIEIVNRRSHPCHLRLDERLSGISNRKDAEVYAKLL